MNKFLMNSSVIVHDGIYELFSITIGQAKSFMKDKKVLSAIGYQETADVITEILGINVNASRNKVMMEKGDEALVFKLYNRVNKLDKGKLTKDFIRNNYSFKLMRRIK